MEKARVRCWELIDSVKINKINDIYNDEINQHMYRYNWIRYLAVYRDTVDPSPRIYLEMDKRDT